MTNNLYHANQLTAYEVHGFINIEDYLKDMIFNEISEMEIAALIEMHNEYCEANSYDPFYENDSEFFDNYFDNKMDLIRATLYGNYALNDDYVRFNGYNNLDSFDAHDVRLEIIYERSFLTFILDNIEAYNFIEVDEVIENKETILKKAYSLVAEGY